MTATYCGKNCAECEKKESLNCLGCKAGPGRQYGGDCTLAQCARSKGHETCDSCTLRSRCSTWNSRNSIPEWRSKRAEADQRRKESLARRAPVLGKWLWLLFWLVIPSNLAALMANETVTQWFPGLYLPGEILSVITNIIYGLILIKLSSVEDRYGTAGICSLVVSGISLLVVCLTETEASGWTLLVSIAATIISLVETYNEYMAHSTVLSDLDNALSNKWEILWKWHIGMIAGVLGGAILALLLPLLGLLAVLAGAVGILVVSIIKLIYLYRTAKHFRAYPVSV